MIYLLDSPFTETSHSCFILDIIKEHSTEYVELIPISSEIKSKELSRIIFSLFKKVLPNDIVLCPWAVPRDVVLDGLFTELSTLCYIVAAAGNFSSSIENYTPAGTDGVITVGTLNKFGLIAVLSNYGSSKEIAWVPGTNYNTGTKNGSGTSVSAALYAAFLAESIASADNELLPILIKKQQNRVSKEVR